MQEQRQTFRKTAFVGGQIVCGDGKSTLFCLVRDISDLGAKLEMSNVAAVPERFGLRINGKEGLYRAKVIWRNANDLGIAFESPQSDQNSALPQAS